jgi:hypothetical protein
MTPTLNRSKQECEMGHGIYASPISRSKIFDTSYFFYKIQATLIFLYVSRGYQYGCVQRTGR